MSLGATIELRTIYVVHHSLARSRDLYLHRPSGSHHLGCAFRAFKKGERQRFHLLEVLV